MSITLCGCKAVIEVKECRETFATLKATFNFIALLVVYESTNMTAAKVHRATHLSLHGFKLNISNLPTESLSH